MEDEITQLREIIDSFEDELIVAAKNVENLNKFVLLTTLMSQYVPADCIDRLFTEAGF